MQNENNSEQKNSSANNSAPKPSAKSVAADVTWVGLVAGVVGLDMFTTESVKKFFNEKPSEWAKHKEGDSFFKSFEKSLAKLVDPKQWKSTAVSLAILIPGGIMASSVKQKMEENAYQKNAKNNSPIEPEALKEIASDVTETENSLNVTDVEHQGKLEQLDKEQTL